MRKAMTIYSELAIVREFSHRNSKAGRRVGKLYSDKREDFRCALNGCSWRGEAVGRLLRSGASWVIGQGCIFGFLWLIPSWKQDRNWGSLQLLIKYWPFGANCS